MRSFWDRWGFKTCSLSSRDLLLLGGVRPGTEPNTNASSTYGPFAQTRRRGLVWVDQVDRELHVSPYSCTVVLSCVPRGPEHSCSWGCQMRGSNVDLMKRAGLESMKKV